MSLFTVTIERSPSVSGAPLQAYRAGLTVEAAEGQDPKLFIYQVAAPNSGGYAGPDMFIAVADPLDMTTYPADAADLDNNMPYYRTSSVVFDSRTLEDREQTIGYILEDIAGLSEALRLMDMVSATETITL